MKHHWHNTILLDELIQSNTIELGRGRIISSIDIENKPGDNPVYSSSSKNNGVFGKYELYDFDEELVTWSIDGGGYFFYRPHHKFSITNVSGFLRVLDKSKYQYKFLYYIFTFQHLRLRFDYLDKAHPSVIKRQYWVPIISIEEQNQIEQKITTADNAIAHTEALIAKYQRIKAGLMQDLLTKGIDEHGNIRSKATHKFVVKNGIEVPEVWEVEKLGKLADFKSGFAFKFEQLTEFGHKVVRISNLHKHDFPFWYYDGPVKENWKIKDGDILFTWAGIATSIDCIKYHGEDALMNQHIYNFIFQNDIYKEYCYRYLQYFLPKLRMEIEGGAGQLHLTKEKIQSIKIPIMKECEMIHINNKLIQIDLLIDQFSIKHKKLKSLKIGLMQDLLSGKVRVKTQD